MAEVIGAIAAVFQLVTTLEHLRRLCKDAKDIQQNIEDVRCDLTTLQLHLKTTRTSR